MTKNIIKHIINFFLLILLFYLLTFYKTNLIKPIIKLILLVIGCLLLFLSYIFKLCNIRSISRLFYSLFIIYVAIITVYFILGYHQILNIFSSVNSLKDYILSTKEKGILVYILIQSAQVVFLPVPAAVICIVGSLIYGPLLGGIYCSIGVLIGSYTSFLIGKIFGFRLVSWIVGSENANKYSEIIRKRGGFFLSIAFLLPMFPDDILCLISGLTNMTFKTFFFVTLITRPIGVIAMSYFGSGNIIPFSGWGLYVWVLILIVAVISVVVTYKYQEKMQTYIMQKIFKKNINN